MHLRRVAAITVIVLISLTAGFLTANVFSPQQPPQPAKVDQTARPIEGQDTVFIEELTWMEVRDALKAGKSTLIVPTGGVEENGPYVVTGKHNYIIRATANAIARSLGNALVAPVVAFVPEGRIDPPTGHMKFPGTISLTEETYERLLTETCSCFRTHGFRDIVLIGDSGGNQKGMKAVAADLNKKWVGGATHVHFIPEYYDHESVDRWLATQGIKETDEGFHDSFAVSATLAAVDPILIRAKQRQAVKKFSASIWPRSIKLPSGVRKSSSSVLKPQSKQSGKPSPVPGPERIKSIIQPLIPSNSGVERYRSPKLAMIVTIRLPRYSGRPATFAAAHMLAPLLMPTINPSSLASFRAHSKASSLVTVTTSFTRVVSRFLGTNPAPMPWILCGPGEPPLITAE
jgi:creatinine amidohydrolase